uniref:Putative secreted protein n=1 Tax=Ixodes ricinus TaxID=34613 RepID=A0A6B0UNV8_IXORI
MKKIKAHASLLICWLARLLASTRRAPLIETVIDAAPDSRDGRDSTIVRSWLWTAGERPSSRTLRHGQFTRPSPTTWRCVKNYRTKFLICASEMAAQGAVHLPLPESESREFASCAPDVAMEP